MGRLITGQQLYDARRSARLSLKDAAKMIGCDPSTLSRQETGKSRVCAAAFLLFEAMAGQFPGSPALAGWGWDQRGLWSPEGVHFTPGEVRALPYLHQIISEYERRLGVGRLHGHGQRDAPADGATVTPLPRPVRFR